MDSADPFDALTVGAPTEDFFADLAARTAAEYREAADAAARAQLLSAEELEAESRRAKRKSIGRQAGQGLDRADARRSGERVGLSAAEVDEVFDGALAKRRRREEATCGVVLQRAERGEFDPPTSTLPIVRPLRRHGARSRQSRAAATRRRGSRRGTASRGSPSSDSDPGGEPDPGDGDEHHHLAAPAGRRAPWMVLAGSYPGAAGGST